jgi:hypothetical protein
MEDLGPDTTKYTSSRRTSLIMAVATLFTLAVPFLVLLDEDGASRYSEQFARSPVGSIAGGIFWLVFSAIMVAAPRANGLMQITCGPKACTYKLPQVTAWDFFKQPFALRAGEIPYSLISGVEKRREKLRKWGLTCSAVCLMVRDQPPRTFVRGGVGDHQWVEAFARDIAARANVALVDRGTASSIWAPWH